MTRKAALLFASVAMLVAVPAAAQDDNAAQVVDAVAACRAITDGTARLACFDRTTLALTQARERHDVIVVDRAQVRKTRQALFGFSLPRIKLFGKDEPTGGEVEVKELTSSITAIHDTGYGKMAWTLADGSTWQMTEAQPRAAYVKVGQPIVIKAGILGSYNADIRGDRFKVKRLR